MKDNKDTRIRKANRKQNNKLTQHSDVNSHKNPGVLPRVIGYGVIVSAVLELRDFPSFCRIPYSASIYQPK